MHGAFTFPPSAHRTVFTFCPCQMRTKWRNLGLEEEGQHCALTVSW